MAGKPSTDRTPTLRVALVGHGISASLTPAMHMAEGRALGLRYQYDLIDTGTAPYRDQPLSHIVRAAQDNGLAGLNITHPYKRDVIRHLDHLSDTAHRLGAVNTVVFSQGQRIGHNTDCSGFATSFRRVLDGVQVQRVLLLGAGGAGAAVAFALLECGVSDLLIHDINPDQAVELVARLQPAFPDACPCPIQALDHAATNALDGIVNATPMGMASHPGSALPLDLLSLDRWVADIVYFPPTTALLAKARAVGCRVMPGAGMAIAQAVDAFELFTGYRADPDRMAQTFNRLCTR
jgi:quinate/shikimate dehydrogenase (NAD+)